MSRFAPCCKQFKCENCVLQQRSAYNENTKWKDVMKRGETTEIKEDFYEHYASLKTN